MQKPVRTTKSRPQTQTKSRQKLPRNLSDLRPLTNNPTSIYRARQTNGIPEQLKLKPKQPFIDKQRVYQQNLKLKQRLHQTEQENLKLKTRLAQMSRQLERSNHDISIHTPSNSYKRIQSSMKSRIRDLKSQLAQKSKEFQNFQKSLKLTHHQEQQDILVQYKNECLRLKGLIQEILRQNPEKAAQMTEEDELMKCRYIIHQQNLVIQQLQAELANIQQRPFQQYYLPGTIEEEDSRDSSQENAEQNGVYRQQVLGNQEMSIEALGCLETIQDQLQKQGVTKYQVISETDPENTGVVTYQALLSFLIQKKVALDPDRLGYFFKAYGESSQKLFVSVLWDLLRIQTSNQVYIEQQKQNSLNLETDYQNVAVELSLRLSLIGVDKEYIFDLLDKPFYSKEELQLVFTENLNIEDKEEKEGFISYLTAYKCVVKTQKLKKVLEEILPDCSLIRPQQSETIEVHLRQVLHHSWTSVISAVPPSPSLFSVIKTLESFRIFSNVLEKRWMMLYLFSMNQSVYNVSFPRSLQALIDGRNLDNADSRQQSRENSPISTTTRETPESASTPDYPGSYEEDI